MVKLEAGAPAPTPAELETHLRKYVAGTHIVAWRFVDDLPYTSTMKVDQGAMRRMFEGNEAN